MVQQIIRTVVIVAAMVAIVVFWFNLDAFDIEPTTQIWLIGGGASLMALGLLYKLLGAWDLIPDWIPLLGSIDDMMAWLVVLIGAGAIAVGWFLF